MPCVESGGGVHARVCGDPHLGWWGCCMCVCVCMYVFFRSIQQEIFSECVLDIVESVLDGYNGSIIASGQTGR